MWSRAKRVSPGRRECITDRWQVRTSYISHIPFHIPIPYMYTIVMYPIFHTTSQSLIVLTTVFFIFPCTGLNDHSYDVEKRPRRTAKPRRPARDPPKERMSTYSVGVVLRDWTIQFLECCYNILMKVVRVSTMLEILNFCNSKQRYVKVHFLRVKKLCVSVKTGLF